MTKFMEWLATIGFFFCLWAALITNKFDSTLTRQYYREILYSPIVFIMFFGLYAALIVLYRTVTFNNCEKEAFELQKEIKLAREELDQLGFKFK
ncbi:dolichol-phosphate mannosyltransferase subunit 3 [Photinus pyralis]|uniref:dolichol-phosphate mannosyltransferase subunit 3 n=1 Tax=Photinus pyralis TaxID=7054 RepID=UPI001267254E|nr:dolichol-phosphate mannosyltransferase subunit 3 [Photinus pyralis]